MSKRAKRSVSTASPDERQGISNRESAAEEQRERDEYPPVDPGPPQPADAGGDVGEDPLARHRDGQTSHKAGSKSIAQKEGESRYPDHSAPPSRKVAGAYGREPDGPADRDEAGSSHPGRRDE